MWRDFRQLRPTAGKKGRYIWGRHLYAYDCPLELYDLNKDIAEKHNIAVKHPDVVAKIEDYPKTARTDSPNWPIKSQKEK